MKWAVALLIVLLSVPAHAAGPDCDGCPDMVAVPAGVLGGVGDGRSVAPFLIARTETTFDQWQLCVDDGACRDGQSDHGWGKGDRPVINVTFEDAQDFVGWLTARTGLPYRLPTEDEWEWAARGGTNTVFPWGDTAGEGLANCRRCGTPWSGDSTAPVASLPPNGFGLHDMAGNVWEWTADCWHRDRTAPLEARDCARRVSKGGAWYHIATQSRPTARVGDHAGLWSYTIGFRVAR